MELYGAQDKERIVDTLIDESDAAIYSPQADAISSTTLHSRNPDWLKTRLRFQTSTILPSPTC